ncbi:hypothetical protein KW850_15690 [Bacillus sp. sid0103]|uniref:hypothetical protein n=1 Tax=Bacillus sp. sid0103 TaxID=2856337 RepID=UPI001C450531|nr:hypothetical protein [Bacillus sp. sid0103]MBV7506707.1 hypothetical protein [Bacillus sp. sid0103]
MKILKAAILRVLAFIAVIIITIGSFVLISIIQEALFIPKDYLIWIFKSPYSGLVIIFEIYLFGFFYYLFNKNWREAWRKGKIFKKYRKQVIAAFTVFNLVLVYTIVSAVTVVTNDQIINYTFLSPQGKEYRYNDIVKIKTGVYGKGRTSAFTHSKGNFFYIIELNDGTKIDLAQVGGVNHDEDERFVIEKLDRQLVNMDIPKESSMKYFEYTKKDLAKIYTDKIRNILKNTR